MNSNEVTNEQFTFNAQALQQQLIHYNLQQLMKAQKCSTSISEMNELLIIEFTRNYRTYFRISIVKETVGKP